MKRMIALTLIPATLAAGLAGTAWAETNSNGEMSDAAEIAAVQNSGMTLNQAIDTAVGQAGGTALSAGWEDNESGTWGFEVEVADASGKVHNLFVNPSDGSVMQIAEQDDDHGQEAQDDESGENGEEDDND